MAAPTNVLLQREESSCQPRSRLHMAQSGHSLARLGTLLHLETADEREYPTPRKRLGIYWGVKF